jgi:hypothetical protein
MACSENILMINNWCDGTNDGNRSGIQKTSFFGIINPEKMINRIFYLNNPPNDPSSSEYSLKRLFNFEIVKLYPAVGYLTPQ